MSDRRPCLDRIAAALDAAEQVLVDFLPGAVEARFKRGDDPVTAADTALDKVLREMLCDDGEGWLSEETVDDPVRLRRERVWVVDPLDGTREFVRGIPEWCVSVALVENGRPVAGGILSPQAGHRILGAEGRGVTLNGEPAGTTGTCALEGALVLASRSEVARGEWQAFFSDDVSVRNLGSVAYKMGLVAAGVADATWTLVPKNEWDVAGGAALVLAAGGFVALPTGEPIRFNQPDPLLPGAVATAPGLASPVLELISRHRQQSPGGEQQQR